MNKLFLLTLTLLTITLCAMQQKNQQNTILQSLLPFPIRAYPQPQKGTIKTQPDILKVLPFISAAACYGTVADVEKELNFGATLEDVSFLGATPLFFAKDAPMSSQPIEKETKRLAIDMQKSLFLNQRLMIHF